MTSEFIDITAEHARTASQIEADVGIEHIATVYAKALLGAAERAGVVANVVDEFGSVVFEILDQFPKFETILASMLISPEEKAGILDRVFAGRLSATMLNFLKVVARHDRLDCLRTIYLETRKLYDEMQRRIQVRLTTAAPLDPATVKQIARNLQEKLGGEPVLQIETDPNLIGGAVIRIGDTVYDGSIANQLEILKQQMLDRNAHEIQSRRDRFCNTTGN